MNRAYFLRQSALGLLAVLGWKWKERKPYTATDVLRDRRKCTQETCDRFRQNHPGWHSQYMTKPNEWYFKDNEPKHFFWLPRR